MGLIPGRKAFQKFLPIAFCYSMAYRMFTCKKNNCCINKMNQAQIQHIIDGYYKKIKKDIKKIIENFNGENIHQFRVAYKKLRAFLRMLAQENEKPGAIKISKHLKKGYTVSGTIRDLQLQQQQIAAAAKQTPQILQVYLTLLQKKIDKLHLELGKIFLAHPVAKSKKKSIVIPNEFQLQHFKTFVQKKWESVNAIIASGYCSDANIHTIRKNLKDLFYNAKIYEDTQANISTLDIWNGKDEKYFDGLLNELGNYQDKCTAIALLKLHWLNSLDKYNREIPEQIKKIWLKEKRSQKRLLVKKLKTDFLL